MSLGKVANPHKALQGILKPDGLLDNTPAIVVYSYVFEQERLNNSTKFD